jgi:predicted amidohydrolase YtcJ
MPGRQKEAGSIEVRKSADFVLIDRDILALADGGHPQAIADTRVLATAAPRCMRAAASP